VLGQDLFGSRCLGLAQRLSSLFHFYRTFFFVDELELVVCGGYSGFRRSHQQWAKRRKQAEHHHARRRGRRRELAANVFLTQSAIAFSPIMLPSSRTPSAIKPKFASPGSPVKPSCALKTLTPVDQMYIIAPIIMKPRKVAIRALRMRLGICVF
jgi:hypothetical protein